MRSLKIWTLFLLSIFATVALYSCDNSLNPLQKDKGIYSIFGYINVKDDVNYVRVKDLNTPLIDDTTADFSGIVSLTNVDDGSSWVLQDTIVKFDSVSTHNFIIDEKIEPSTTYRIRAERPDGMNVTATTTTPNIAEATAEPVGEDCATPITYSFDPVDPETFIQLQVGFELYGQFYSVYRILRPETQEGNADRISISLSPSEVIKEGFCGRNPECPLPSTPPSPCPLLTKDYLTINYIHYGPDYDYQNDSNVSDSLLIPGGTGEFIGLLKDSYQVPIDTSAVEL